MLARRDHGGDGQLRLHPRPLPDRRGASRGAQPRARRGHLPRGHAGGDRVELGDVRRVPRRGGALAQGHQLRRLRRALRPAHLRHGRARLLRAGHRRGPGGDEAGAGGRARRGGHGLHDLAHAQPRDGGPPAGGQPRGRVGRGAGAGAGDGRPRRRHLRDRRRGHRARSRPPARLPRPPPRPRGGDRRARHLGDVQQSPGAGLLAAVLRSAGGDGPGRWAHVRPGAQPRAERAALVRDPAALRPAAGMARAAAAPARRAARGPARSRRAPAARGRGERGRVRARGRRGEPATGLRLDLPDGGSRPGPTAPCPSWPASAVSIPSRR